MKTFCFWTENGTILKIENRVHIMNEQGKKQIMIGDMTKEEFDEMIAENQRFLDEINVQLDEYNRLKEEYKNAKNAYLTAKENLATYLANMNDTERLAGAEEVKAEPQKNQAKIQEESQTGLKGIWKKYQALSFEENSLLTIAVLVLIVLIFVIIARSKLI